jgi:hypothetical protein
VASYQHHTHIPELNGAKPRRCFSSDEAETGVGQRECRESWERPQGKET